VDNLKIARFNYAIIGRIFELVFKHDRNFASLVDEIARFALNREIIGNYIFFNEDKILAFRVKALETSENDVTHAFNVSGPIKASFLDFGVTRSSCHLRISLSL